MGKDTQNKSIDTHIEQLKAYSVIDNNGFGKLDWDMLANEWDAEQLTEWGVDLPIMESEIDTLYKFNPSKGTMDQLKADNARLKSREGAVNNFREWVKLCKYAEANW